MKLVTHGLPLRSAVVAKRRRRLRLLAAISALCLLGFIGAVAREAWPLRSEVMADLASVFTSPAPADAPPAAAQTPSRPVYRHSIVPGGAYSRHDVAEAMRKDAVVAAHYQAVHVDKVHARTVASARAVYVSYRVGDQVYWTKNRVRLTPGETVLTDGDTEIRARCGNLLSDHARQPVAAQEPPTTVLDEPEPETGSSTTAAARGDEDGPTDVPFLSGPNGASSVAFEALEPSGAPALDTPMWSGGGGATMSPYLGSSTGTTGTSLVAPLGGSPRIGGGSNGGGSNGGGSNGGDSNGGGSNGGDSNGGGSNGGGEEPPPFSPPTTSGEVTTTTGDAVITTTGNVVNDTTGGGDDGKLPAVPEPGALVLFGLGACGAASRALRARRR